MAQKKTVAIIPARYASTRLPGKVLLDLGGKTILERVYERAQEASLVDEVVIATDHEKVYETAKDFGANVLMTREDHSSGTDRIAELAAKHNDWSIIVNVQGDEPFINPDDINKAIEPFRHDPTTEMASLFHDMHDLEAIQNPNNVKVVVDINDQALYFSRSLIPCIRNMTHILDGADLSNQEKFRDYLKDLKAAGEASPFKKHIGLYAYRRDVLLALSKLKTTKLEDLEKLEQLRALENGIKIKMIKVESNSPGIDTPEDLKAAHKLLES